MHGRLILTLATILALSAGGAPAKAGSDPADGAAGTKQNKARRPERRETEIPSLFRELCPHRTARLERMRKENPERFRKAHRHLARKMHEMGRIRRENAEEFTHRAGVMRLEDKAVGIADKLRASKDEATISQLTRTLRADLEELFEKKEEAQRMRLKRMERDLQKMKQRLDDRRRNRPALIEKRLKELAGTDPAEF